jgi:sphingosine kinase
VAIFRNDVRPILEAAGCHVMGQEPNGADKDKVRKVTHFVTTTASGDAEIVASAMPLSDYDVIMCVGGDGTVHEVINGLANRTDGSTALKELAIATIPAGSSILTIANE